MIRRALAALVLAAHAGCATPVPPAGPLDASVSGALEFRVTDRLTLSGTLAFPGDAAPVPAVVLMHGCSGIGASVRGWERELRGWGYATFVVDSFRGRGLREVCVGGWLASEDRTGDAYAALVVLAAHPRIDATRIALMGFSHGGGTTLVAAVPSVAAGHVPAGGHSGRRVTRTAQTLYSGIFDDGSNAEFVRKFAADSSSFTNGTNTAPGRTASVTRA